MPFEVTSRMTHLHVYYINFSEKCWCFFVQIFIIRFTVHARAGGHVMKCNCWVSKNQKIAQLIPDCPFHELGSLAMRLVLPW